MSEEKYVIELSKLEALVLFEFLSRYDESDSLNIIDTSEMVVLMHILGALEKKLWEPFSPGYLEILEKARSSVRQIMEGNNEE